LYYTASGIITPIGGRPVHVIKASFLLSNPSLQNTDKDHVTGTGILPIYACGISSLINLQSSKLAEYKSS